MGELDVGCVERRSFVAKFRSTLVEGDPPRERYRDAYVLIAACSMTEAAAVAEGLDAKKPEGQLVEVEERVSGSVHDFCKLVVALPALTVTHHE